MESNPGNLKSSMFGGFKKKDVLSYIFEINESSQEAQQKFAEQLDEVTRSRDEMRYAVSELEARLRGMQAEMDEALRNLNLEQAKRLEAEEMLEKLKYDVQKREIAFKEKENALNETSAQLLEFKSKRQELQDEREQVELAASEERTFCPDYFLNALLTDFYERATRSLVSMDVFVEPGFHIERVKDSDVGVVMGNLLDNALEAARPHPQGFVDVKLYMQNGGAFAVIRIENNYVGGMDVIEDSATKKEPRDGIHGLGLKIVNQVVEKYGGHVHRDCSDDSYVTAVILPTKTGS